MHPGSAASAHADVLTETVDLCRRTAGQIFHALHEDAPGASGLCIAAPKVAREVCEDIANRMLCPMMLDDRKRVALAECIALGAVRTAAASVGRDWP